MRQFKLFVDINEEEKFLNEKARQGYILEKYSSFGVYHFKQEQAQDLNYKIDYRVFTRKSDFNDYIAMFEDAGWKHVYGTTYSGNQYFLPISDKTSEDIFSDNLSKAKRYERFSRVCQITSVLGVIYFLIILQSVNFNVSQLFFLTPGLWDKQGGAFWAAFFFELPFVVLRVVPIVLMLIITIAYGIWAHKAKKLYEQQSKED
jgi:hypothetical protein